MKRWPKKGLAKDPRPGPGHLRGHLLGTLLHCAIQNQGAHTGTGSGTHSGFPGEALPPLMRPFQESDM